MHMDSRQALALVLAALLSAACGGKSGAIACGSGTDTQSDPQNCGACSNACAKPAHADAICLRGVCARGPCEQGWTTLDPDAADCDMPCSGGSCGGEVVVVPLTGPVFEAFASGSSYGDKVQVSADASLSNTAVMGESTPPPGLANFATETSAIYSNMGGLNAALQ